jgi:nucleoside-diphosphate-sugar epimerase
MAYYLIAGVTGYVGSRLARRLLAEGHRVRGIARTSDSEEAERLAAEGVVIWAGDLIQPETLIGVAEGVDAVYNLTSASLLNDAALRATLVTGNQNLIAACSRSRSVRAYIAASNVSPYGDGGDQFLDEDTPVAPCYPLGFTTVEAERTIMQLVQQHHFPAIIVRLAPIYGPGRDMVDAINTGMTMICGSGRNYIAHIQVDDLVEVLVRVVQHGQPGSIYNVADDEPLRLIDLHGTIRKRLGMVEPRTFSPEVALASGLHPTIVGEMTASVRLSNTRLKHDLNLELRYPSYHTWLAERLGEPLELEVAVSA